MSSDPDTQAILEEVKALLNKALELLVKIEAQTSEENIKAQTSEEKNNGQNSKNHQWERKFLKHLFRDDGCLWWQCKECGLTPTTIKPYATNDDMPIETECPGPAKFPA